VTARTAVTCQFHLRTPCKMLRCNTPRECTARVAPIDFLFGAGVSTSTSLSVSLKNSLQDVQLVQSQGAVYGVGSLY
jgi:hypothetical protein